LTRPANTGATLAKKTVQPTIFIGYLYGLILEIHLKAERIENPFVLSLIRRKKLALNDADEMGQYSWIFQ
jgi:hypothetical protein